ncbi:MAG: hypothetical protein JW779_04655 [Candidatus Thorarchaeota archaeon]|nr:hypothetical protein [Candidatus Thorarchaeota archaeon]
MTILDTIQEAVITAKRCILENLEQAKAKSGSVNPYGDKTLVLDLKAEDEIISILQSSDVNFAILTEERGYIQSEKKPEYLALVDPIDGSANLARGIPLVTIGISIVPYKDIMTSDDAELSIIESVFTDECYIAISGKGVTRNRKSVHVANPVPMEEAIVSYDTKKTRDATFIQNSTKTISSLQDTRRTASNLLDLCWTASGFLDGMVDLRGMLPIIHLSGTHMVNEAGGFVLDSEGNRFHTKLNPDVMMSFVAASNEHLARKILNRFNGTE